MPDIAKADLADTTIAGTEITVQQLVDAYLVSLDGKPAHELEDHFGQYAEEIGTVRNALRPLWSAL